MRSAARCLACTYCDQLWAETGIVHLVFANDCRCGCPNKPNLIWVLFNSNKGLHFPETT